MTKEKRRQIAQLGGRACVEKYGLAYMAEIGRRGAAVTWQRYRLQPVGLSGWAMVDRVNGCIRATIHCPTFG